ncbi:MAG: protein translocase subunit SecD, partial [Dehalococcoidia bacterium]|nr:protein translocase subunit SecD [Dehalococcoidia bacterium]
RIGENGQPEDVDIGLTGADLRRASAGPNPNPGGVGRVVNFEFNERGAQIFADVTARLALSRGQIAIYLDNQVISAPTVNTAITGGRGFIEGNFTVESANELAIQLNSGALQAPVTILRTQDVDATLGTDSVRKSVVAGQIGLLTVALFMILYYRLPGVISVAALVVYIVVTLAVFRLIPVTLTLAGIAGFILSIGMAVDANILIFERMREELRAGRSLNAAIEAGFSRAWSSIRDSNVATIITAVILYWFGSNFGATLVQGFALTLLIGVLVSMFSAITVSRTFLRVVQELFFASGDLTPRGAWLFGLDRAPTDRGRPNVSATRAATSR